MILLAENTILKLRTYKKALRALNARWAPPV